MDKEKGAATRKRINGTGPDNPLASFKTSADLKCGDVTLAAGEYKVYFTISEDCAWQINFAAKDKVATMKLDLKDSGQESKRCCSASTPATTARAPGLRRVRQADEMLNFAAATAAKTGK